MLTVDIFNMSEDVWPFIQAISDDQRRQREIEENASMGDREIWCVPGNDGGIVVCPQSVSEEFLNYVKDLTDQTIKVFSPEPNSGTTCENLLADTNGMQQIIEAGRINGGINLVSYCTSDQFYKVSNKLTERGVKVKLTESPEEINKGVINDYGTKSGIRKIGQRMMAGWTFDNQKEAAKKAAEVFCNNGGVVIKTNKGHSGMGVEIFYANDLPKSTGECELQIMKMFSLNKYWSVFPIVVEELADTDRNVGGGSPDTEFLVDEDGKVKMLYQCGMKVSREGEFAGLEIGPGVLSNQVEQQMKETGERLGREYAKKGYRGYFDADFVVTKKGELFLTESNIRRTGGTHVYLLAKRLLGENFFENYFVISNNWFKLPGKITFAQMKEKLKSLLFDKLNKRGVVIVTENTLGLGRLGYIVFGGNREEAEEIEREMIKRVNTP